ncbi:hypothetical protein IAD21_04223 [Abditibacteriota bacterium]|nr:hypothetical protein IAD21_04223 [Abditibacteriota bacterium]
MIASKFSILLVGAVVCLFTLSGRADQQSAAAQGAPTQDNQVIEQVGDPSNGFTLTTRFDKAVFKNGEPIKVAFRLKNLRPTLEYFSRSGYGQDFGLKVTTADGKLVPLTQYGRIIYDSPGIGSSITIKMKPGDKVSATLYVNRIYDMSEGGKYNITVSTRAPKSGTVVTSKTTSVIVTFDG